jgi:hypothetical protein
LIVKIEYKVINNAIIPQISVIIKAFLLPNLESYPPDKEPINANTE